MSKVLFLISPTLNSFADKRKGTSGNKIDCAFQHFKNSTVSNLQIGATTAGAGLIGYGVVKNSIKNAYKIALKNGSTTFHVPFDDIMLSNKNYMAKAKTIFKAIPTPVKVIAGALIGLSLLVRTYKKGTIEQKYLDRAQFVDNTFKKTNDASGSTPIKK